MSAFDRGISRQARISHCRFAELPCFNRDHVARAFGQGITSTRHEPHPVRLQDDLARTCRSLSASSRWSTRLVTRVGRPPSSLEFRNERKVAALRTINTAGALRSSPSPSLSSPLQKGLRHATELQHHPSSPLPVRILHRRWRKPLWPVPSNRTMEH